MSSEGEPKAKKAKTTTEKKDAQDDDEEDDNKNGDSGVPSGSKDEEDSDDSGEASFDFRLYLKPKEEWIANAIKAIQKYSGNVTKCFTLSTFFDDELQGSMPNETINMTCGIDEEGIMKAVIVAEKEKDGDQKAIVEYEGIGLEGGGTPASSFGKVNDMKSAVDWLLREIRDDDNAPKLYLRLWPLNANEGEEWVEVTDGGRAFNDLNDIGLLEGPWFKKGQTKLLNEILAEMEGAFRACLARGKSLKNIMEALSSS